VAVCPEKDTLYISATRRNGIVNPLIYAVIVCMLFVGGSLIGRVTGNWQTVISNHEYLFHVKNRDMPFYNHNRGQTPAYNKDAWLKMMTKIREAGDKMQ
jgi:hypothetical protein